MLGSELLDCGASSASFGFLSADSRVESAPESESESPRSLLCDRLEEGAWVRDDDVPTAVSAETGAAEAMSEEAISQG